MIMVECRSGEKDAGKLVRAAEKLGTPALFLNHGVLCCKKQAELAFLLAREAFMERKNISGKLSNEALLFLACETNFSSALRKIGAKDGKEFVLVCEKSVPIAKLKKQLNLTKAAPLALTEWGKRKGNYTEGELACERMALERIMN